MLVHYGIVSFGCVGHMIHAFDSRAGQPHHGTPDLCWHAATLAWRQSYMPLWRSKRRHVNPASPTPETGQIPCGMSIAHSGEGDCKPSPLKAWSPWVQTSWGGAGPLPPCVRMPCWVLEGLCVCHVEVRTRAYREGSLFVPTMITITFFYMGGNTSHMCGDVVWV
jgi:hypothetical protein